MKKLISIFGGILLLLPLTSFAFTDPTNYDCTILASGGASCSGSTITFTGSSVSRYGNIGYGLYFTGGTTYYATYTVTGSGNLRVNIAGNSIDGIPTDIAGSQTDLPLLAPVAPGNSWNALYFDDTQGFTGTVSSICVSDHVGGCTAPPPPPSPPSGIDAAVGIATSSFANTFGFDMDGVASWMWDNLGQPILGSGIGTLYVMRFYWLGFIAIGLIVFFCFAYFRFFKK